MKSDSATPESTGSPAVQGLVLTGMLLRLGLSWAPFSYLATRGPLIDDAFYVFSIARNLAGGQGPTADGVHATSGFQPLYALLLVPFYLFSPDEQILPIHLALSLLAICGGATGWLVYRVTRRLASHHAALFSLVLWTFSPYFLSQGQNGLETGLFGFLFLWTLDQHLANRIHLAPRKAIRLGVLLGLTILARVDGLFLALGIAYDLWRIHGPIPTRLRRLAIVTGTTLSVTLPYWLFLYLRFDALLPESGQATRVLSLAFGTRFVLGARSISFFPLGEVPWLYYLGSLRKAIQTLCSEPLLFPVSLLVASFSFMGFFNPRTWFRLLMGGAGLAVNLAVLRRPRGAGEDAWRGFVRVAGGCGILWIPAYTFFSFGQWWFARYFFPLFLLMVVASGVALDALGRGLAFPRQLGPKRWTLLAVILHCALFAVQVPGHFFRQKPNLNIVSYINAAQTLDKLLPPGARAGAFQSGTISYFSQHTVLNLDGVTNGDARRALEEGQMAAYIRKENLAAIIDWPWIMDALLTRRSPPGAVEELGPARTVGPFRILQIQPSP